MILRTGCSTYRTTPEQKIDLSKSFVIELDGILNAEGRLDAKSKFTKIEGDEGLKVLQQDAVKAIDAMGVFHFLHAIQNGQNKLLP